MGFRAGRSGSRGCIPAAVGAVAGGAGLAAVGLLAGGAIGLLVRAADDGATTGGFVDLRPALPLLFALVGGGLGWFAGAPVGVWLALERGDHRGAGETGLLLGAGVAAAVVLWVGWLGWWSSDAGWTSAVLVVLATHGLLPLAARLLVLAAFDR